MPFQLNPQRQHRLQLLDLLHLVLLLEPHQLAEQAQHSTPEHQEQSNIHLQAPEQSPTSCYTSQAADMHKLQYTLAACACPLPVRYSMRSVTVPELVGVYWTALGVPV